MADFPQNWIEVPFTKPFDIQGGTQPPKSSFIYEEKEGYIRLLQIRDFGEKPGLPMRGIVIILRWTVRV